MEAAAEPFLYPWLVEVLDEWGFFGSPVVVASGELATFVFSRSADLYAARVQRLDELGCTEGARDFFLRCYQAADRELLDMTREDVSEAMKKAAERAKANRRTR